MSDSPDQCEAAPAVLHDILRRVEALEAKVNKPRRKRRRIGFACDTLSGEFVKQDRDEGEE